jgi:hypothetical protein
MAFCNSCGATVASGTTFCNKCGAATDAAATPPTASYTAPPPSKPSISVFKTTLIVVGTVVFVVIAFGIVTMGIIAHRLHGRVESLKDPEQAVKDLGVDIYPGAKVHGDTSASITFGNLHTIDVWFTSTDPVKKVCTFYSTSAALQPATFTTPTTIDTNCSVVSNRNDTRITINVVPDGSGSKFNVTAGTKKATTPN